MASSSDQIFVQAQAQSQAQAQVHAQAQAWAQAQGPKQAHGYAAIQDQLQKHARMYYNRLIRTAAIKFGGAENIPQDTVVEIKQQAYAEAQQFTRGMILLIQKQQQQQQAAIQGMFEAIEPAADNIECSESGDGEGNNTESARHSTLNHDLQSRVTRPSTVPTSHPGMKKHSPPPAAAFSESGNFEMANRDEVGPTDPERGHGSKNETEEQRPGTDDCDVETSYSIGTLSDDPKLSYLQVFAEQLTGDMKSFPDKAGLRNIEAEDLDILLKEFAWKLHSESVNPFQWEASAIIHKKRKNIVELLVPRPSVYSQSDQNNEAVSSKDKDHGESFSRVAFMKTRAMIMKWLSDVEMSPLESKKLDLFTEDLQQEDFEIPSQLPHYQEFIRESEAYHWLLAKIRQHDLLTIDKSEAMLEIRTKIRNQLRAQEPLQKMSSRRPPSAVKMTFNFDWSPTHFMRDTESTPTHLETLRSTVYLTGSWNNAQAASVKDYMDQTWPRSEHALTTLMQTLLSIPQGQECYYQAKELHSSKHGISVGAANLPSKAPRLTACFPSASLCRISVTGHPQFVSEISEQIGWLASALQSSSDHRGQVARTPSIKDLQVVTQEEESHAPVVVGSCTISFTLETPRIPESSPGFYWSNLFCDPVLVCGYPILRRTQPNTGLEMSLANMAAIVGSQYVVKWGDRLIIKGFNMLMIATMAAVDLIVWHLLISERPEERIPYNDPRLDALDNKTTYGISLRMLEEKRHVIGWCTKVTDLCGDATANLNIQSSGLLDPPSSIVIDRLYVSAGSDFVAGFDMGLNKKEKPFWLEREKDYPSLLNWVVVQPVVFYDVAESRAWLTDGASALLHLVRVSLYLDMNDPDTAYEWVFDTTDLIDKWPGATGRQAALMTLKHWDNLNLKIYVSDKKFHGDGRMESEYATLKTRIQKILHYIEILIDKQTMSGSQDGIRLSQIVDFRHGIVGFDIRDIIDPSAGTIRTRLQHIESRGHGWVDLISSLGTTTIFGRGFGDLIRPDEPLALCRKWKPVPANKDYMATTVSTLQMLYERRLLRINPGLGPGELTTKIVWASFNHPFKSCDCLKNPNNAGEGTCHIDSVQFLVAKGSLGSWKLRHVRSRLKSLDLMTLDKEGAIIFGSNPFLSRKSGVKPASEQLNEDIDAASSVGLSSQGMLQPPSTSPAASDAVRDAGSTDITSISFEMPQNIEIPHNDNSRIKANSKSNERGRRWEIFTSCFK